MIIITYKYLYDKISVLNAKAQLDNLVIADINKEQTTFGAVYIHNSLSSRLSILNNLGIFYWKIKNYGVAEESFENALNEQGSPIEMAKVHYNCGLLEVNQYKHKKAMMHFTATVNLHKDYKHEQEAENLLNRANEKLINVLNFL